MLRVWCATRWGTSAPLATWGEQHVTVRFTAVGLKRLRSTPKGPLPATWIDDAIKSMKENGPNLQHVFELAELTTGPIRGKFSVYLRQHISDPTNYSAGMTFTPLGDTDGINLVRANGPHPHPHTVDIGGCYWTFAGQPHIHYCTEHALQQSIANPRRYKPDRFAVVVGEYHDIRGAARALAKRTGIGYQGSFDDLGCLANI